MGGPRAGWEFPRGESTGEGLAVGWRTWGQKAAGEGAPVQTTRDLHAIKEGVIALGLHPGPPFAAACLWRTHVAASGLSSPSM